MNTLIIDIGTSSMRGILFDRAGEKLAVHQVKYQPDKLPDGRIEQSPEDWTGSLTAIASKIAFAAKEQEITVDAVAVTAQRSSIIPIDRDGKPLMNTLMWQDRRNAYLCEELAPYNDLVFERSGAKLNTVFSGSRMMWIRKNCPDVCEKLYKFVNIPEYVMHYMTGNYVTDTTYGSRSHLMNLRERKWDPDMLRLFEVKEEELCTLQEPGSVVGYTTEAFAAETGLPAGIPVVTAGGDQQCAAIGQGAFREGNLSLVAGTGGFLVTAVDDVPENLSSQLICNCSSVRGHYMVEANVLTCCSAFDWYCRTFYDWGVPAEGPKDDAREDLKDDWEEGEKQAAADKAARETAQEQTAGKIDYGRINRDLAAADGKVSQALVIPYFQGRSTPEWNPNARALFGEISLNTTRTDLLKGLLEGICMEIQNNISLFGDYTNIEKAYISGGLTNSPVINQLQADIYGIPLYHMEDSESTALGALMVTMEGLQVYPSLDAAFETIRGAAKAECYEPRADQHEQYEKKRRAMNALYQSVK